HTPTIRTKLSRFVDLGNPYGKFFSISSGFGGPSLNDPSAPALSTSFHDEQPPQSDLASRNRFGNGGLSWNDSRNCSPGDFRSRYGYRTALPVKRELRM